MEKKRNNKRVKKNAKRQRQKLSLTTGSMRLYKVINSVSQATPFVLSYADTLQTVNGTAEIVFGSNTALYWDLSSIATLSDFTEQSDGFRFVKVKRITVDILRTSDEVTMFSNLRGGDVYINYYPDIFSSSVTYADLSRDINSYRIDVMTFDPQRIVVPIPDYAGYNINAGIDYWLNPSKTITLGQLPYVSGQLAIRTSNTTNNNAVVVLFKLMFKIQVVFYHRG